MGGRVCKIRLGPAGAYLGRRRATPPRSPRPLCGYRSPCCVDHPPAPGPLPHPEASPDRPGAVTVSRIVARNSGHPQPYTGAGGSTQALGGWAGSKLERVEFPAGGRPPGPWGPVRCHLAVPAEIRRFLVCGGIAVA